MFLFSKAGLLLFKECGFSRSHCKWAMATESKNVLTEDQDDSLCCDEVLVLLGLLMLNSASQWSCPQSTEDGRAAHIACTPTKQTFTTPAWGKGERKITMWYTERKHVSYNKWEQFAGCFILSSNVQSVCTSGMDLLSQFYELLY